MKTVAGDGITLINQGDKKIVSVEDLMLTSNINPELRDILFQEVNMWTTTMKGITQVENYQVKAKLQPRSLLVKQDIMEVLKGIFEKSIKPIQTKQSQGGDVLANINHFDLHINRYEHNTKKYLKEIDDRTMRLFELLLRDKPSKLLYINGGDYLNTDIKSTTTKGTQQLNSLKEQDAFRLGLEHQAKLISTFASELPVEVVYLPGNHSIYSEAYLAQAMELFFSKTDGVDIDSSDNPIKKKIWGDNAIAIMHGDMIKDNQILPNLTTEGINKKYMYAMKGDKHIRATKEIGNLLIDTYPSTAENCDWSKRNGWNKVGKIYGNSFDKKHGKIAEYGI